MLGQGSVIEKFTFNLKGQSVLISQYFKMHNLREGETMGRLITRSEIVKQPS